MKILRIILCTLSVLCGSSAAAERPADVYILSGQSNMQGTGLLAELSEDDRKLLPNVYYWNGKTFEPLIPGQTKTSARKDEFGPEITFAKALGSKSPGRDVYLIKHYVSGQPLHHGWNSDTVHNTAPGLARMGRAFAEAMLALQAGSP